MTRHALLSASGSKRWINCPPSARIEAALPDKPSNKYAEEGSLAHSIGELKLRRYYIEPMSTRKFNAEMKKFKDDPLYIPEMDKHTDEYLEVLKDITVPLKSPFVAVETQVDYSVYAREGFGTCDALIIHDSTMWVIDLKYGQGVAVEAENNPQMMLYALGAYEMYKYVYANIQTVKMMIFQPRAGGLKETEMSLSELLIWGEQIKPIAKQAYDGVGRFKSGEWCKWCKCGASCKARADFNIELEPELKKNKTLLSNAEIGELLERGKHLTAWYSDLQVYALDKCVNSEEIPGWKAVAGKSLRQFTDQEEAFKILLGNKYEEVALYERKPLSLAQIEKLVGKAEFEKLLSTHVCKAEGKPTLTTADDKRPAITRNTAAQDFAAII